MAKAHSMAGKGSGWHGQSARHARARRTGSAGGHHVSTTRSEAYKDSEAYRTRGLHGHRGDRILRGLKGITHETGEKVWGKEHHHKKNAR